MVRWLGIAGVAGVCAAMFASGCVGQRNVSTLRTDAPLYACLPAQISAERLRGEIIASHALRPSVSSVRLRTTQGEIVMYWSGERLMGIDLAPENEGVPLWIRDPGEACRWRYGNEKEA